MKQAASTRFHIRPLKVREVCARRHGKELAEVLALARGIIDPDESHEDLRAAFDARQDSLPPRERQFGETVLKVQAALAATQGPEEASLTQLLRIAQFTAAATRWLELPSTIDWCRGVAEQFHFGGERRNPNTGNRLSDENRELLRLLTRLRSLLGEAAEVAEAIVQLLAKRRPPVLWAEVYTKAARGPELHCAYLLRHEHGWSYREIAEFLDPTLATPEAGEIEADWRMRRTGAGEALGREVRMVAKDLIGLEPRLKGDTH